MSFIVLWLNFFGSCAEVVEDVCKMPKPKFKNKMKRRRKAVDYKLYIAVTSSANLRKNVACNNGFWKNFKAQ